MTHQISYLIIYKVYWTNYWIITKHYQINYQNSHFNIILMVESPLN
jgi:hypothetical protein